MDIEEIVEHAKRAGLAKAVTEFSADILAAAKLAEEAKISVRRLANPLTEVGKAMFVGIRK